MSPDAQPQATSAAGQPSWMAPVTPVIPDHELVRRIGGGSYGDVWLARTAVGTWRAVKVVFRDRFTDARPYEREFSGMQKFEPLSRGNEAFVDLLQIGRNDADGYFYYVMELADDAAEGRSDPCSVSSDQSGEPPAAPSRHTVNTDHCSLHTGFDPAAYIPRTLSKVVLQRGRLPVGDCLELGLTLNLGLAQLHRAGLIHRDIKPSNIIFVGGVPKLADIGLVIEVAEARSFVGTEGFIPPEGPNSPQADLFSLGKVLYEAGMGKDRKDFPEPFTQLAEAPDAAALLEFNAILLKACAANRAERYRSAEEMNADLALLQSGGSVRRQRRLARQLRFVQRAGVVLAALAALIALGWWWQARQTRIVRGLVAEKSRLVEDKTRMADEDHRRLVRLAVANGVREMEQGDLGAALRWLTDALMLNTNNPADATRQRIRLHQVLALHPRLLQVFPHPAPVRGAEFSPDERQLVTACDDGRLRLWAVAGADSPAVTLTLTSSASLVRFTRDGRHLFVLERTALGQPAQVSLREAQTGQPLFPPIGDITCAALSPDDRWLVVARPDYSLELIETATGRLAARMTGHTDRVERVAFSPDSAVLVSASRDRTVRRWQVAGGAAIGAPLRHDFPVAQAVFNADGSRLATATAADEYSDPVQFQTWSTATGRQLGAPLLGWGPHALVTFDGSGRHLLTADREPAAILWSADAHVLTQPPLATGSPVRCLDFSPDGAYLALGGDDGTVRLWKAETGRPAFTPLRQSGGVRSLRFNGDGTRLLMAGDDGAVRLWDLALPPAARSRQLYSPVRPQVALVDAQSRLLLAAHGPKRLWQVNLGSPELDVAALETSPASEWGMLVVDAEGRQWAHITGPAGHRDLRRQPPLGPWAVELWRRDKGAIRRRALPHPAAVPSATFRRDGERLLTAATDRVTRIWRTGDGTLEQSIAWPAEDAHWLAVSPDLRVAITLAGDERAWHLVFRDVGSGVTVRRDPEPNPDVRLAAFSPDGRQVGLFGGRRPPQIYEVATGAPLMPSLNHGGVVTWLEWSPDGGRVLTAGDSSTVRVWDASTGASVLPPLTMGARPVERGRFSPDGQFIVARCDDDFVRVWDAATGEALTPALRHRDTIRDVFITTRRQLVSVQNSGEIRVWNLAEAVGTAADLSSYARLLNGSDPAQATLALPAGADDLAAGLRALRARQADWFAPAATVVPRRGWDSGDLPSSLGQAQTALFHLERLARQFPAEAAVRDQLARCRSFLIPARDPATPPRLLDLSRAYTHSFDLLPRGDFAGLPRGRQTLAGTEFDLRGLVQLDHRAGRPEAPGPFHPAMVIEVGQRCRALHFLQATIDDPLVEDAVVARWTVDYADGSTREWPVVYGRHVRDLWWRPSGEPLEAAEATLAWRGVAAIGHLPGTDGVRLFKATWMNPQPDLEITHLEFRVGETSMKPIVVAVTAE